MQTYDGCTVRGSSAPPLDPASASAAVGPECALPLADGAIDDVLHGGDVDPSGLPGGDAVRDDWEVIEALEGAIDASVAAAGGLAKPLPFFTLNFKRVDHRSRMG